MTKTIFDKMVNKYDYEEYKNVCAQLTTNVFPFVSFAATVGIYTATILRFPSVPFDSAMEMVQVEIYDSTKNCTNCGGGASV